MRIVYGVFKENQKGLSVYSIGQLNCRRKQKSQVTLCTFLKTNIRNPNKIHWRLNSMHGNKGKPIIWKLGVWKMKGNAEHVDHKSIGKTQKDGRRRSIADAIMIPNPYCAKYALRIGPSNTRKSQPWNVLQKSDKDKLF